jgi:lauroyl/myristoyl acyltransferase
MGAVVCYAPEQLHERAGQVFLLPFFGKHGDTEQH